MDWNKGFSARFYGTFVDPDNWRDIDTFSIVSGSIKRSESSLIEAADFECTDFTQSEEKWVRLYADIRQGLDASHVALFTGLASSPDKNVNGNLTTRGVSCYSVLKPADDVLLQLGWYAPAESDSAVLIKTLLDVTPAPVIVSDGAPRLKTAIISGRKESNLSMAIKILNAINWRVRLSGDGTIQVEPMATEESASYDALENDAVEPEIKITRDWYGCPNVFRAVSNDLTATARDDSQTSPMSTVNRGREVWMEETGVKLCDGESIADYALRRLKEEQNVSVTAQYNRRYNPNLFIGDLVRLHYPKQGLEGNYKITSQSITLGHGLRTEEEVMKA